MAVEKIKKLVPKNLKKKISNTKNQYLLKKLMREYYKTNHSTIRHINIEFATFCNLRCKWCSLDHSKEKVNLSEEILEKFLKNLVFDKRFKSVKELNLWNAGEILLNGNLLNLLKILKKYKDLGFKKNQHFPDVYLLTNGMLLSEELSKKILDIEVIDKIIFSVDGGTKEEYEEIRRGAKWKLLVKNIKGLLNVNNKRVKTEVICMVDLKRPLNTKWMEKEFREVLEKIDVVKMRHPHNWDGSVDLGLEKSKEVKKGCFSLMNQLVLLPNGDVTVCCADLNSRGVIGNIKDNTLFEIYRSKKRKNMIVLNLSGNRSKIPLCENCDIQ